ncbi:MAG TPA: phasin family protein [Croceibacterium sp.]|nr:phasin family protein [Croceibacterium sp.]
MADEPDSTAKSAEKAYAEAVAEVKPEAKVLKAETPPKAPEPAPAAKVVSKPAPTPAVKTKAPTKKRAVKSRTAKPAAKPAATPARVPASPSVAKVATRPARVRKPAARKKAPSNPFAAIPPISELKEKIMATAKTTDFTKPLNEAIGEFQSRAQAAYEKSSEALSEATEFAKGNVEALVESGKIIAGGAQDMGKTYVEEAKSAYETMTTDFKELAAVKSPTELFQLQGKIARRNFDALVATGSKNTEAFIKLAGEAFAPISGRVNVAAEKLTKAA